jgi:radical SAM superfamily enzyme YgiQ (UPF0313 family)
MHVLLIGPPWTSIYGRFQHAAKVGVFYPPLGLCYLASALEAAGHTTRVVDAEAENLDLTGLVDLARRERPDLVGIQVVSPLWDVVLDTCRALKTALGVPIVLGGPHVSITGEEALEQNAFCDYGVIGEGEETLVELADRLARAREPVDVDGIVFRARGGIVRTGPRTARKDLDAYAFPDRGDLPMERYLFSVPGQGARRFATITTTRGCPFNCTFCSEPITFGRKTRFRSPQNVVDEIESTQRRFGTTHFIFVDDTLTVEKKRVYAICDEILRRELKVTLEGWTHANTVDVPLLAALKRAGLVRLSFGVESGDADILRSLDKGTDHARIVAAYRAAKSVGLETRGSVILGLPGDTRATVERTIDFVTNLRELDHCYFNIAMPYPGTRMREAALRGEHGTRLLSREYSVLRRQGQSVVMEVNDLRAADLLQLQRSAYRRFWLHPRRVLYNVRRAGLRAAWVNGVAFARSFLLPERRSRTRVAFLSEISAISDRTPATTAY